MGSRETEQQKWQTWIDQLRERDPILGRLPAVWCIEGTGTGFSISLAWEQWTEAVIVCPHGRFRGTNFAGPAPAEALACAVTKFGQAEHPHYCTKQFTVEGEAWDMETCELWEGHKGPCGYRDDE